MNFFYLILVQFILTFSCFSAELEKATYDYNNNKDSFKNQMIISIDKKIVKKIEYEEYLLFYDKYNNLIKIEKRSESESGDSLSYLRQYYQGTSIIYFDYLYDVIPDSDLNFVAKGYVKDNLIIKYKIYGNKRMGKWNINKIREELSYPSKSHLEYIDNR